MGVHGMDQDKKRPLERTAPSDDARPDEPGQGLAEYALILALIAIVCIGGVTALGVSITSSVAWTSFGF